MNNRHLTEIEEEEVKVLNVSFFFRLFLFFNFFSFAQFSREVLMTGTLTAAYYQTSVRVGRKEKKLFRSSLSLSFTHTHTHTH